MVDRKEVILWANNTLETEMMKEEIVAKGYDVNHILTGVSRPNVRINGNYFSGVGQIYDTFGLKQN